MRIAIVGSGIAGLGCAHALLREAAGTAGAHASVPRPSLTLYEAAPRLGGHTHTLDVALDGRTYPVDTGFLVFNERTYPRLIELFAELRIPVAPSDMSFAVSLPLAGLSGRLLSRWGGAGRPRLEWSGADWSTVFAQRRNLLSPRFLTMLADVLRFNRDATRIAVGWHDVGGQSLGEFLDRRRYSQAFRHWYLLPMAAAIWSCPTAAMMAYPVATFARFCHNHGLLQIKDRPQWFTVRGGARQYVEAIAARVSDIRLNDPVLQVTRLAATGKVGVLSRAGRDSFDHVVLACHSDQSLRILADADRAERDVLSALRYQPNRALLHTDPALMPRLRSTWSAWNYLSDGGARPRVCVTYWLNKLQPLPFATPLFVTLNPITEPAPAALLAEFDYAHPIFDQAAIDAQQRLPPIQGKRGVWFAGAWTGYGFHEDGLKSGADVAAHIRMHAGRQRLRAA